MQITRAGNLLSAQKFRPRIERDFQLPATEGLYHQTVSHPI
jgi:hypothetical protein